MLPSPSPVLSAATRRPVRLLAALAAALVLLAACAGGSGSSGFDLAALEDQAIERAVETSMCQEIDGLTICAAGETLPAPSTATPAPTPTRTARHEDTTTPSPIDGTPTRTVEFPDVTASPTTTATPEGPIQATPSLTPSATPTPTEIPGTPNVGTSLGDSATVPCLPGTGPCVLDFVFVPENIDPSATYWVAVRMVNPPGDWVIYPDPTPTGSQDDPMFEQPIEVDFSDPEATYQIAVLVFSAPPSMAPESVERLGETNADLAFVTPVLTATDTFAFAPDGATDAP